MVAAVRPRPARTLTPVEAADTCGYVRSSQPLDHDEWWVQCFLSDVPYLGVRDRQRIPGPSRHDNEPVTQADPRRLGARSKCC